VNPSNLSPFVLVILVSPVHRRSEIDCNDAGEIDFIGQSGKLAEVVEEAFLRYFGSRG
jgi:hypothetical protein